MLTNGSSCDWEDLPSMSQIVSSFVPICMDMIQLNYNTCPNILPWYRKISASDFLVVAAATLMLTLLKPLAMELTLHLLKKFCDNSGRDLSRASEMIYECLTRILVVSWTFYDVLLSPQCSYLVAPTQVLRGVWESADSGSPAMSPSRRFLLLFAISRYSSALIDVLFLAEKRRDAVSLVIHHVVAVLMMTAAYTTFPELGLSVFFLHEVCDPSLEMAKILHYLQTSKSGVTSRLISMGSEVCFVVFTVKWFVLRFYLYPARGMYPGGGVDRSSCQYGSYAAAALLAAVLFLLNTVWSFMIIRAIVNRFLYNRLTDETMDSPQDYVRQQAKQPHKDSRGSEDCDQVGEEGEAQKEDREGGKAARSGKASEGRAVDELVYQRIGDTL